MRDYRQVAHKHIYKVTGEYLSTGKNLLGQMKTAKMENIVCTDCNEENVRLKKYE